MQLVTTITAIKVIFMNKFYDANLIYKAGKKAMIEKTYRPTKRN